MKKKSIVITVLVICTLAILAVFPGHSLLFKDDHITIDLDSEEDMPQEKSDVVVKNDNHSILHTGDVDAAQVTYGTVQVLEQITDTNESFYQIGVALPGTDFSSVGQMLKDKISQDWDTFDSMTGEQRLLSSRMWGIVNMQADTWDECEEAVGFTVHNPLETFEWINKAGYFGSESADPNNPAKHIQITANATNTIDRKIGEINITTGYNSGDVRITLTAILSANAETYTIGNVYNGYATYEQNTVNTGTGMPVLVVTTNETNSAGYYNGDYFDPTGYWVKDNVFYILRVFGNESDKDEIQTIFDRILDEI